MEKRIRPSLTKIVIKIEIVALVNVKLRINVYFFYKKNKKGPFNTFVVQIEQVLSIK